MDLLVFYFANLIVKEYFLKKINCSLLGGGGMFTYFFGSFTFSLSFFHRNVEQLGKERTFFSLFFPIFEAYLTLTNLHNIFLFVCVRIFLLLVFVQ